MDDDHFNAMVDGDAWALAAAYHRLLPAKMALTLIQFIALHAITCEQLPEQETKAPRAA